MSRYSYAVVEKALASVFGADAETQAGALRGRLKNFQRLGLPGIEAGKGSRIPYSEAQIQQWLIALLMSEFNLPPTVTVEVLKKYWSTGPGFARWIKQATDAEALAGNPIFLTLRPRLMSGGAWRAKGSLATLPYVGSFRRFDLHVKDSKGQPIPRENIRLFLDDHPEDWLCTINLTRKLSALQAALQAAQDQQKVSS